MSVDSGSSNSALDAQQKPKPPIRARKKKFIPTEDAKQLPRRSEFIELSTSDIVVDRGGVVPDEAEEIMLQEEKEEVEGTTVSDPDKRTDGEIDLDKDEWEVIPESAASDDSCKVVMDEPCLHPNGYVA